MLGSRYTSATRRIARHAIKLHRLKKLLRQRPCRVVIGAGGHSDADWIPTDNDVLNLLKPKDWSRLFEPAAIDALLAEHVWEHLTLEEGVVAASLCFRYLRPGGYLRVAVPDGLSPDPEYIESVRVGGSGAGAKEHKVLYTYKILQDVFEAVGFKVVLYEYYDQQGRFHCSEWDPQDGTIRRSKRFDRRNKDGVLRYTSIVLDAKKE